MKRNYLASVMLAFTFLASVAIVPLTSCTAFNLQTPENFNERVVAGYKLVEVAADLVAEVSAAGKISKDEANESLDRIQEASNSIGLAVALKNSGDFSQAETRLAAVISALELIQSQLKAK